MKQHRNRSEDSMRSSRAIFNDRREYQESSGLDIARFVKVSCSIGRERSAAKSDGAYLFLETARQERWIIWLRPKIVGSRIGFSLSSLTLSPYVRNVRCTCDAIALGVSFRWIARFPAACLAAFPRCLSRARADFKKCDRSFYFHHRSGRDPVRFRRGTMK